jgi:hypothetical protein
LELSKKSWLLAIQFPDREQPSLYPIVGGDAERLMAKLTAARDRWAKASGALPMITLCYEVGYDAFWLARFLKVRGIECLVIVMIETAWLWTRHQPKSALTRWFVKRTAGQSKRVRKIMIVAVARKLAIALWRYVELGLVPQGAILNPPMTRKARS